MSKLVLLGGPTGVGKSTTLALLTGRLPKTALLDADDVWRVSTDLAIDGTRDIAIGNVVAVMRGYFEAGCELGVLAWVFARPELYEPVIAALEDQVESVHQLYLIANREQLERRLIERGSEDRVAYSISRLDLIERLPYTSIDTSRLTPDEVCEAVLVHLTTLSSA